MAALCDTRILLRRIKDLRCFTPRRTRVKTKWAASMPKYPATRLALHYFDTTYSLELGQQWPSVRAALLSERKYGALLNNFSDHSVTMADLQDQGCIEFISDTDVEVQASLDQGDGRDSDGKKEERFNSDFLKKDESNSKEFSTPNLHSSIKCLVFPRGDITRFKPPRPDMCGLLSYYLMDAASVLPCLALDVQEGDSLLDLCAAPGGKTVALLQTQAIRFLCVNDESVSRTSRLKRVLNSYVPKQLLTDHRLRITSFDGTQWGEIESKTFDRVLVDVPCTTDRHSVTEDDNNIFSRSRTIERRNLPQLQKDLLLAGVQAACPGGVIVYSTCSLSQLQNQYVVEQAIHQARESHGIQLQVVSLRPFTRLFRKTFQFASDLPLGEMVLPHLTANFGPIYMCKLRRLN